MKIYSTYHIKKYLLMLPIIMLLAACSDVDSCIENEKLNEINDTTITYYYVASPTLSADIGKAGAATNIADALAFTNLSSIPYDESTMDVRISGSIGMCQGDPLIQIPSVACNSGYDYNGDGMLGDSGSPPLTTDPCDRQGPDPSAKDPTTAPDLNEDYQAWYTTVNMGRFNDNVDWDNDGYTVSRFPTDSYRQEIFKKDYAVWRDATITRYQAVMDRSFENTIDYNNDGTLDANDNTAYTEIRDYWQNNVDASDGWTNLSDAWSDYDNETHPLAVLVAQNDMLSISTGQGATAIFSNNPATLPYMEKYVVSRDYDGAKLGINTPQAISPAGFGYYFTKVYNSGSASWDDGSLYVVTAAGTPPVYSLVTKNSGQVYNSDKAAFNVVLGGGGDYYNQWYELNNSTANFPDGGVVVSDSWNGSLKAMRRRSGGDLSGATQPNHILWPGEELVVRVISDGSYKFGDNLELDLQFQDISGEVNEYGAGSAYNVTVPLEVGNPALPVSSPFQNQAYFDSRVKYDSTTGYIASNADNAAHHVSVSAFYNETAKGGNTYQYMEYRIKTPYFRLDTSGDEIAGKLTQFAHISFNQTGSIGAGNGYRVQTRISPCVSSPIDKTYLYDSSIGPIASSNGKIVNGSGLSNLALEVRSNIDNAYLTPTSDRYDAAYSYGSHSVQTIYKITHVQYRAATSGNVSAMLDTVMISVRRILYGSATAHDILSSNGLVKEFFVNIVNGPFGKTISIALTIYISYYAFIFLAGLNQISKYEFVIHIAKISVIVVMLNAQTGWTFLSEHFFVIFTESVPQLANLMFASTIGGDLTNKPFAFADAIIDPFFTAAVWKKILALLPTGPFGILYVVLIILAVIKIFFAVLRALFTYIFSVIAVSLLLAMAPVFMTCLLFPVTKPLFDKWWTSLLSYAIQPVMMFIVMSIMAHFLLQTMYYLLNYGACWSCVFRLYIPFNDIWPMVPQWTLCIVYWYVPWGWNVDLMNLKPPVSLFHVIAFLIFVDAFERFVGWALLVSQALMGTYGTNLAGVSAKGYSGIGYGRYGLNYAQNLAEGAVKGLGKRTARVMAIPMTVQLAAAKSVATGKAPLAVAKATKSIIGGTMAGVWKTATLRPVGGAQSLAGGVSGGLGAFAGLGKGILYDTARATFDKETAEQLVNKNKRVSTSDNARSVLKSMQSFVKDVDKKTDKQSSDPSDYRFGHMSGHDELSRKLKADQQRDNANNNDD